MNRIYQGRVTGVEINCGSAKEPKWRELEKPEWEKRLWAYHSIFQDAVNYYLMALFALAGGDDELVSPIRKRLNETDENGTPTEDHVWTHTISQNT